MKIAIDGPAGAGKSTVAKLISEKLGINYLINIGPDWLGRIPYKSRLILEEVQKKYLEKCNSI